MKKVNHRKKTHAVNSLLNLILSVMIVGGVFAAIVFNLLADPTEIVQEVGLKTFRMYTVLSNMFVGITAAMSIPFAVDGLRERNYHLPRWIIRFLEKKYQSQKPLSELCGVYLDAYMN